MSWTGRKILVYHGRNRPQRCRKSQLPQQTCQQHCGSIYSSDMQNLIALGEYSICYNLIDYIIRRYGQQKSKYPILIKAMFNRLVEDWKKFERDPIMMTKEVF